MQVKRSSLHRELERAGERRSRSPRDSATAQFVHLPGTREPSASGQLRHVSRCGRGGQDSGLHEGQRLLLLCQRLPYGLNGPAVRTRTWILEPTSSFRSSPPSSLSSPTDLTGGCGRICHANGSGGGTCWPCRTSARLRRPPSTDAKRTTSRPSMLRLRRFTGWSTRDASLAGSTSDGHPARIASGQGASCSGLYANGDGARAGTGGRTRTWQSCALTRVVGTRLWRVQPSSLATKPTGPPLPRTTQHWKLPRRPWRRGVISGSGTASRTTCYRPRSGGKRASKDPDLDPGRVEHHRGRPAHPDAGTRPPRRQGGRQPGGSRAGHAPVGRLAGPQLHPGRQAARAAASLHAGPGGGPLQP